MVSTEDGNDRHIVRVITETCRNCGKPIEVISPTWYTMEWDLRDRKNPRFTYCYEPDETALCVACCLDSKLPDERREWEHHLNRLLRRKKYARVPTGATLFHHRHQNTHIFERTDAVHHTDFYFLISRHAARPDWSVPTWTFTPDDGTSPTVHIWVGVDVTLEGIDASLQVTWNVEDLVLGQSTMQVADWGRSTHEDLKRLMEGARFLYEGAGLWRGRPPKRTTLTKEEFLEQYQEARAHCLREDLPLTSNNLLIFLPISKATLTRYRKKWLPQ